MILSPHMEPPFSSILNWSAFSLRFRAGRSDVMQQLKPLLRTIDYARLPELTSGSSPILLPSRRPISTVPSRPG